VEEAQRGEDRLGGYERHGVSCCRWEGQGGVMGDMAWGWWLTGRKLETNRARRQPKAWSCAGASPGEGGVTRGAAAAVRGLRRCLGGSTMCSRIGGSAGRCRPLSSVLSSVSRLCEMSKGGRDSGVVAVLDSRIKDRDGGSGSHALSATSH
jgi:hypothetical protein